jgi:hypothetical protein
MKKPLPTFSTLAFTLCAFTQKPINPGNATSDDGKAKMPGITSSQPLMQRYNYAEYAVCPLRTGHPRAAQFTF